MFLARFDVQLANLPINRAHHSHCVNMLACCWRGIDQELRTFWRDVGAFFPCYRSFLTGNSLLTARQTLQHISSFQAHNAGVVYSFKEPKDAKQAPTDNSLLFQQGNSVMIFVN